MKNPVGRPKHPGNLSTAGFELGAEHKRYINNVSKETGLSKSEVLRRILDKEIKKGGSKRALSTGDA